MSFLCDFCSTPAVAWSYPARTFVTCVIGGIISESLGAWVACTTCKDLIEAGNRRGLAEHSLEAFLVAQPQLAAVRDDLFVQLLVVHAGFFAHRTGDPVPFC